MKKSVKKISVRAYANSLGITHSAINRAISDGKIVKGVTYKTQIRKGIEVKVPQINKLIADKEYGNLHKSDKTKPGQNAEKILKENGKAIGTPETFEQVDYLLPTIKIPKDMPYGEAIRYRELIGLALDKLKLQESEGVLVKKEEIERILYSIGNELKKALLNIPARITADVRAAANDVEAQMIITIEIVRILSDFSKMKKLKLN